MYEMWILLKTFIVTLCVIGKTNSDRQTNKWYILGPCSPLIFFPDRRTLKFLEVKCNPTKCCGLTCLSNIFENQLHFSVQF